ncbi:MAG: hypothetical protein K0S04_1136 [Herbinix sp.]|nr:hypothetical protein [Herbinix sp.]
MSLPVIYCVDKLTFNLEYAKIEYYKKQRHEDFHAFSILYFAKSVFSYIII